MKEASIVVTLTVKLERRESRYSEKELLQIPLSIEFPESQITSALNATTALGWMFSASEDAARFELRKLEKSGQETDAIKAEPLTEGSDAIDRLNEELDRSKSPDNR